VFRLVKEIVKEAAGEGSGTATCVLPPPKCAICVGIAGICTVIIPGCPCKRETCTKDKPQCDDARCKGDETLSARLRTRDTTVRSNANLHHTRSHSAETVVGMRRMERLTEPAKGSKIRTTSRSLANVTIFWIPDFGPNWVSQRKKRKRR
jgi:hypothetical protein